MIYRDLFSHRQKGSADDSIFSNTFDKRVRVGIFNIIKNNNKTFDYQGHRNRYVYDYVKDYCENHFLSYISDRAKIAFRSGYDYPDHQVTDDLYEWFQIAYTEQILDFIEVIIINMAKASRDIKSLIKDINDLFQREKVGYEIINNIIIPKSNEYMHQEVVKGSIITFKENGFEKSERDFMDSLDALSKKDYGKAITMANTAFESTMKKVLNVSEGIADDLVDKLIEKGIVPNYFRNKMMIVSVVRHKEGDAHGRLEHKDITREMAEYAIHCAGANIVFIIKRAKIAGLIS